MTRNLPEDRVLSTLNADGTRNVLHPKLARGRFLRRRRVAGYALVALFVALPFLRIGGRPAFLIDLVSRELSIAGLVFRPSDGFILMLVGLAIVLTVFLVTALFGRVWCGWACPQTVYLEHVFRPIERWLEGSPAQQQALDGKLSARRVLKWAIYGAVCFALANVFLAYFVGTARLYTWVLESPRSHVGGFAVVTGVAVLMLFDFAYFREQMCIVACPYGRLQTVLLDAQSLIIGYDAKRGEPRARPRKRLAVVGEGAPRGDCVDCSACVTVCPTGIDIRQGLQMECIGCAQCVDACDSIMAKVGKPPGLIRYTSVDELAGKVRRILRTRTVIYPLLLACAAAVLVYATASREAATVTVERVSGPAFIELPDGRISAQAKLELENQSSAARTYTLSLVGAPDAAIRTQTSWHIASRKSQEIPMFVDVPRESFHAGERRIQVRVDDGASFDSIATITLLGPVQR